MEAKALSLKSKGCVNVWNYCSVANESFSFLQVKKKQEQLLKVRNFLPPQSQEPEIFLLEKLVNQAAEADQRLESVAKAQGQTSDGKPKLIFLSIQIY